MSSPTPPERGEIVSRLATSLAELLRLESADSITAESDLREDLGVDSLGLVDLVTVAEEDFSIRFSSSTDFSEIHTVGDVAGLIEIQLQKASGT
ncbi:MAG: acyl carrier protein [Planctomycetes bacterium]|nr:acyl carrier protein [Planctomycetota bacterium]MCP4770774.1 acyl carrier protein [Planctomycetota bacterium]MCP4862155.1 acyl carrier protein [Planctomycetota bacterium]